MSQSTLFLIDGHALCYRSFYAIRDLTNREGQATNAVYGFVNTLRKIIKEHNPTHMAVCFDSPKRTRRQEKYEEYKIQRPSMPEDLSSQIPIIKDVLAAYRISIFEEEGYEADDIIATLAIDAAKNKGLVTIVTDDKDMYQLATAKIQFLSLRKDEIMGPAEIEKKYGFSPTRIADFLGLAGDSVDNIPGISGIGKVTATQLIQEFGSIEDIIAQSAQITKVKLREKIIAGQESALMSKELAILETNVPVECALETMRVNDPDASRLFELFTQLDFKRFAQEYGVAEVVAVEPIAVDEHDILNDKDYVCLETLILKEKRLSVLLNHENDEELDTSLCVAVGNQCFDVPKSYWPSLTEIFKNKDIQVVTHDCKRLYWALPWDESQPIAGMFDVMLASFLLTPTQAARNRNDLAWTYLKQTVSKETPLSQLAVLVGQLFEPLYKELKERSLYDLFNNLEMPLAYVLYRMERQGVGLDTKMLKELSEQCDVKIQDLQKRIFESSGEEFNLNSPKQLAVVLFEKMGLPVIKKTKTGFSTDEGVLSRLALEHDVPALVLEYRQLTKLKSTYIDALPKLLNATTGKLHAEFDQIGAETGRLSSRHPNLQNIPIRTDLGRQVRKAIIPHDKKNILLAADYSQIELRVLAHLSQDDALLEAFNNNQDIHNYTASLIFEVEQSDVDRHMRDTAKRVNFGIVYGMSGFGLAKDLKISQREAQDFIDRYFLRYPKVRTFMDEQIKYCEDNGYVVTLLNRRRYIPDIKSRNNAVKQFAQRQAINTPVQGSAADMMKMAMIAIQRELTEGAFQSAMNITVHDELVFEVDPSEKEALVNLVRKQMEHTIELSVPIVVSIKSGKDWLNMKAVN